MPPPSGRAAIPMTTLPRFDGCGPVEKLHAGPISDLYRAQQEPLGRKVTIKALGASILPSSPFAATLEREARVLAALSHPNIVSIHDFVRRDDRMWLVLEHVEGFTLEALLAHGRLPVEGAVAVTRALARGLEHAHGRGIVHRDVRPSNVVVALDGAVKLMNFSVAAEERLPTAPELLDGATSLASLAYQSPEQILGEPPDPRSDLFSLGIVLFEMLTGSPPFGSRNDPSAAQRIRNDPLPPLARNAPDASAALERVVQRSLAKLPADRFQTAADFERALAEVADPKSDEKAAIRAALGKAGLAKEPPPPQAARRVRARGPHTLSTLLWLGVAGALLTLGFATIRVSIASGEKGGSLAGQGKLELAPTQAAYLRVVAQPWADVYVDGEQVETTPFARPIPLSPGTHYVKLTHPQAPEERRDINLAPGETLVLDVNMKVPASSLLPTSTPALSPSASPDAGDDSP
jgi:serine/threonine-protein kinase